MNYEERLQDLLDELDLFQDWTERYEYIISLGKKLPRLDEAYKTEDSLIKGCQSRVWLHTEPDNGVLKLYADSDSLITKGLIAVFIRLLSGLPPEEILKADNMIQPGDAAFIYTDEHVNSQYRSNILAYYTTWSHDKCVPIREYVAWVDQMTKPSFEEDQTEAHPAVYRMI